MKQQNHCLELTTSDLYFKSSLKHVLDEMTWYSKGRNQVRILKYHPREFFRVWWMNWNKINTLSLEQHMAKMRQTSIGDRLETWDSTWVLVKHTPVIQIMHWTAWFLYPQTWGTYLQLCAMPYQSWVPTSIVLCIRPQEKSLPCKDHQTRFFCSRCKSMWDFVSILLLRGKNLGTPYLDPDNQEQ